MSLTEVDQLASGEQINTVRAYLSLVRYLDFTIHQATSSFLENQLVDARKQDKDLGPSIMHTWLTVSSSNIAWLFTDALDWSKQGEDQKQDQPFLSRQCWWLYQCRRYLFQFWIYSCQNKATPADCETAGSESRL